MIEFLFEGDLYTDLCGLSPVLTEHSATVATDENTRFDTVKRVFVYSHCRESLQ